jgi:tetraacyldisaccharide 4'-kinase
MIRETDSDNHRKAETGVLPALASRVFGTLVGARNQLYDRGWVKVWRASRPVISIGNLTVGGAGKTPLTLYLAGRLLAAGVPVGVLTRGYGRLRREPIVLSPDAPLLPKFGPDDIGDEPWFLRRRLPALGLGVDGRRRRAAADLAPHLPGGVFLLDDGFQHRSLHRDLDLVVVAAGEPLQDRGLLPFGRLREPPSSLARADRIVVVMPPGEDVREPAPGTSATMAQMERFARGHPVALAQLCLRGLRPLGEAGSSLVAPSAIGGAVGALAGIARPERLADGLEAAGMTVAWRREFPDHHRFSARDLETTRQAARGLKAIVTTEKDEPRLLAARARSAASQRLATTSPASPDGIPILVAVVDLVFLSGEIELLRQVGVAAGRDIVS